MIVLGGSTDVTTYFALRLASTGVEATGLTITNFDLQYVRSGVAPVAKVDAVALAATDTAHTDNRAIEVDTTDQPGLYRVDWPDAAFAAGVREVILTVKCATVFTEHLRVGIVGYDPQAALATPTNITGGTITTVTNLTNAPTAGDLTATMKTSVTTAATAATPVVTLAAAAVTAIWDKATSALTTAGSIGKLLVDNINATISSRSSHVAADVWAVATRVLTAATNLTALASQASVDTIDGIVDNILLDTAEIGAAGAGLTAINLPNQTMDIVGNITGNLSGSVGSVTGAVGSVTGLTAADVGTIKTQTDKMTFTVANQIDANIQYVNDVLVTGDGQTGTEWGP